MPLVENSGTVADLIAVLEQLPPDAEVDVSYPDHHPISSGDPCSGEVWEVSFEHGVATLVVS